MHVFVIRLIKDPYEYLLIATVTREYISPNDDSDHWNEVAGKIFSFGNKSRSVSCSNQF